MTKIKGIITFALRFIALAASIIATVVMATSHGTASVLGLKFEAKFTNSPTFVYYVAVYAIVSAYSLVVLLLPFKNLLWRLILVVDMVMTLLMTSALSSAMAIAYVGKKGNSHAGWLPICGQVPKFCNETSGALIVGIIAGIIYLLLVLYSLYAALSPFFPGAN